MKKKYISITNFIFEKNYINITNKYNEKNIYIILNDNKNKKYQIIIIFKKIYIQQNIKLILKQLIIQKKKNNIFYIKFLIIIKKNSNIINIYKILTNLTMNQINYNQIIYLLNNSKLKSFYKFFTHTNINFYINVILKKLTNYKVFIISNLKKTEHYYKIKLVQTHKISKGQINISSILKNLSNINVDICALIKKNAKKTNTKININILTLHTNIKCNVKPYLKIHNNNIICNHAVTITNMDKNIMYYILSKGYCYKKAKKLYTKSFLYNILKKFPK